MPTKKSSSPKYIYILEHLSGETQFNSVTEYGRVFDDENEARTRAAEDVVGFGNDHHGEFDPDDWFVYIVRTDAITQYKLKNEGITFVRPQELIK